MKVAICFSGIPREGYLENIEQFKKIFDITDRPEFECVDFFYSTYNQYELPFDHASFPETNKTYLIDKKGILESGVDKTVHKIYDMKRSRPITDESARKYLENKMVHGYKQILAHALQLLFQVPSDYDIIVRARYDNWLSEYVDWLQFVKESYEKNIVYGVANITPDLENRPHHGYGWHNLTEVDDRKLMIRNKVVQMSDNLIVHKRNLFDPVFAVDLFNKDSLMGCECGWYQIFSKLPDTKIKSFYGGIMIHYEGYPHYYTKETFYSYK